MTIDSFPEFIRNNYEMFETRHATAILENDFPSEWRDVVEVLSTFRLRRSDILKPGGRKTAIADAIDSGFYRLGWIEKAFETKVVVDQNTRESPTHKVDCFKNRVALEVEWNNKDPFFDRDLNNFRLLFDLRTISVGIIVTRSTELHGLFAEIGKKISHKYGMTTTHMERLRPRIEGGGGGGCPILAVGIKRSLYVEG